MNNKDIRIGVITPWGIELFGTFLKDWRDVDINKFMELHYISVRTSKENYEKVYRFKIIPADDK
jgi:hypothetical protein